MTCQERPKLREICYKGLKTLIRIGNVIPPFNVTGTPHRFVLLPLT